MAIYPMGTVNMDMRLSLEEPITVRSAFLARFLCMVFVGIACLGLAEPAAGGPRRALVIGNDAYYGDDALTSCVNDAKSFVDWLQRVGYEPGECVLITDATKREIVEQLNDLVRRTSHDRHDQVVIYYSGHGCPLPDDNGDEGPGDDRDEALVAVDPPDFSRGADYNVIRDDYVHDVLQKLSRTSDQVVLVLDSCFSGGGMKSVGSSGHLRPAKRIRLLDYQRIYLGNEIRTKSTTEESISTQQFLEKGIVRPPKGLLFISACSEREEAQAAAEGEHLSAFTSAFLETVDSVEGSASGRLTLGAVRPKPQGPS